MQDYAHASETVGEVEPFAGGGTDSEVIAIIEVLESGEGEAEEGASEDED